VHTAAVAQTSLSPSFVELGTPSIRRWASCSRFLLVTVYTTSKDDGQLAKTGSRRTPGSSTSLHGQHPAPFCLFFLFFS
jgi:hypothetical protein